MKSIPFLSLFLLITLSSFTSKRNLTQDNESLLSIKKITNQASVNVIFFNNGSTSIQKLENGKQISSKTIQLSTSDIESLKKIVTRVRPIELRSSYTCMDKKVNKKDATIYAFSESKKIVVVNNTCQATRRLNDLKVFIDRILKENS